jgi:hypothetical protein
MLVNKPVVKPTEKDEIVEIGGASIGPVLDVMGLHPSDAVTSDPPAVMIPGFDQPSQPAGDRPTVSTHSDHDVVPMDGDFDHGVTGETSSGLVGDHRTPGYLGDTTGCVVD